MQPRSLLTGLDGRCRALLVAVLLLATCLVEPRMTLPRQVFDWYLVLDITQSMNVRDYDVDGAGISRLQHAKQALREALRALPCGSRVALGLFTERDALNIMRPLEVCAHFSSLDRAIAKIDWRMAWAADSFIAHGLFSALAQSAQLGPDTRVAFISDGNQAPPANVGYLPQFEGEPGAVRGLVFGAGGSEPAQIPRLDEHDNIVDYWAPEEVMRYASFGMPELAPSEQVHGRNAPHGRNPAEIANAHLSAVDEDNLRKLAGETGLEYAHLGTPRQFARALTASDLSTWRMAPADLRPWLALPAMLLILASFLPPPFFRFIRHHLFLKRK